ncbi:MAG: hypothetical protein ACRD93_07955 [Nitrososphaeraceae archaeon]
MDSHNSRYYPIQHHYFHLDVKVNSHLSLIPHMASYDALKASVAKNGEVMIRLDTGEKIELHIHNVKFEDATKEIMVDAGTETYWIGADRVSYYWIHKEGFEKE